jgi:hypothetical protein
MKFLGVLFLTFLCANCTLFGTNTGLKLRGADSVIPPEDFKQNPSLSVDVYSKLTGAFTSIIRDDISYDAHETYYASLSNIYPALVSYNISTGLKEIDRVSARINVGIANGAIAPERNYGVISTYESTVPQYPVAEHIFKLEFHNISNGHFDQTPVVFDLANLDPNYYNASLGYNNLMGISTDGQYAIVTYAVSPTNQIGVITGQNIEVLRINSDLSVTSVAKSSLPDPGIPGLAPFSVGAIAWESENGKYSIEASVNSWNLQVPLGANSRMAHYTFDPLDQSLTLDDTFWVPQYIEDFDVDLTTGDVYVALESVSIGPSIYQFPLPVYNNDAIDKNSELQVIKYVNDEYTHKLGVDLEEYAVQVRVSHDGKKLALVTASSIAAYVDGAKLSPLGAPTRITSTNEVKIARIFKLFNKVYLDLKSFAPAPDFSLGLAFSEDDNVLSVAGITSYQNVSGVLNGEKGKVLYDLV